MLIVIQLVQNVLTVDDFLNPTQCSELISIFHSHPKRQIKNGRDMYAQDTTYTERRISTVRSPQIRNVLEGFLDKAIGLYRDHAQMKHFLGNEYEPFELMKFEKGADCFSPHFDSCGQEHFRSLAIIIYLNDVDIGGELEFLTLEKPMKVSPVQGRCVVVPADWTFLHKVHTPISNDRYSLITFLRYGE